MKRKLGTLLSVGVCAFLCFAAARCDNARLGSRVESGTLRVLITDKPFPFDLIEEALVTITRVEVRRAGTEDLCATDADCDDGAFCNGAELCEGGECEDGDEPCEDDAGCDEENDVCVGPCTTDADCDDDLFCNGIEECLDGECAEGFEPCLEDEICDDDLDMCVPPGTDDGGSKVRPVMQGPPPGVGGGGDSSPFITIFEGEEVFNLLDLQGGRTDVLADAVVPAGTYTQMRIIVTEGQVTLKDDAGVFDLFVPSGAQTGIKLNFTFEVSGDDETTLLLDVDMSKLFVPVPGGMIEDPSTIETFIFRPSVAMRLINILDAGSISGTVTDGDGAALADVAVTAFDGDGAEVTSTATAEDGTYVLGGLSTGEYSVEFSLAGFDDVVVPGVEVTAGETTAGVDAVMAPTP